MAKEATTTETGGVKDTPGRRPEIHLGRADQLQLGPFRLRVRTSIREYRDQNGERPAYMGRQLTSGRVVQAGVVGDLGTKLGHIPCCPGSCVGTKSYIEAFEKRSRMDGAGSADIALPN